MMHNTIPSGETMVKLSDVRDLIGNLRDQEIRNCSFFCGVNSDASGKERKLISAYVLDTLIHISYSLDSLHRYKA